MKKGERTLEELLALASTVVMTEEEKEEQRRSWAYGNTKLSNPAITREMVDEVADARLKASSISTCHGCGESIGDKDPLTLATEGWKFNLTSGKMYCPLCKEPS